MQYTIGEIKEILRAKGNLPAPGNRVTRLLTDSRSLSFPEETLFFAIKTRHGDGHDYVETLYSRGVRNFIVNNAGRFSNLADANILECNDSTKALQQLAAHLFR